jgi:hypothetical protein
VRDAIENSVVGLFDRMSPDRPEDLVLLRRENPYIATIARERDA